MRRLSCFLIFSIMTGCISVSMLQSPVVLEKNSSEITIGLSTAYFIFPYEYFVSYRRGLGFHSDFGIKVFNPSLNYFGIQTDFKHNISEKAPYLGIDLGISLAYGYVPNDDFSGNKGFFTYNFFSSFLFGDENKYIALRLIRGDVYNKDYVYNPSWIRKEYLLYGLTAGLVFNASKRFRIAFEINFLKDYYSNHKLIGNENDWAFFPTIGFKIR